MQTTSRAFGQLLHLFKQSENKLGIRPLTNAEMSVLLAIIDHVDKYGANPTFKQIAHNPLQINVLNSDLHKILTDLVSLGFIHKNTDLCPHVYYF